MGGVSVTFTGEEGTGPGVNREWLTLLARQLFNADYALCVSFCSSASDCEAF